MPRERTSPFYKDVYFLKLTSIEQVLSYRNRAYFTLHDQSVNNSHKLDFCDDPHFNLSGRSLHLSGLDEKLV